MTTSSKTNKSLEEKNTEWRKGYDLGVSITLRNNEDAIQIGRAILDVLDRRYEGIRKDY